MEYLLNKQQSSEIDKISIEKYGLPSVVLMENAGGKTASWISSKIDKRSKIAVICGPGNNGGDGFVVARHLFNKGYSVKIFPLTKEDKFSKDELINYNIAKNIGIEIQFLDNNSIDENILSPFDIVIDAIFGIGLTRYIEGFYKKVIEIINNCKKTVFSIDIPSGLSSDRGEVLGISVKADYTATYGYYKLGHIIGKGYRYCGEIKKFDISFPKKAIKNLTTPPYKMATKSFIQKHIPKRYVDSYKKSYGDILICGGSKGKTGAIGLTSEATLKSGVGLVTIATDSEIHNTVDMMLKEVMVLSPFYSEKTTEQQQIKSLIEGKTAIAIGPGISLKKGVFDTISYIVKEINIPTVIDADGLNLISTWDKNIFKNKNNSNIVLTPHIGEMAKLTDKTTKDVLLNPIEIASKYAKDNGIVVVLKGYKTVIASSCGDIWINNTGNNGLATAGSGDCLTGIIGAFLAQGISPLYSAISGVYIHGLSADIAVSNTGYTSMTASDIIKYLPEVFKSMEQIL